jgi:hypothetical protein
VYLQAAKKAGLFRPGRPEGENDLGDNNVEIKCSVNTSFRSCRAFRLLTGACLFSWCLAK